MPIAVNGLEALQDAIEAASWFESLGVFQSRGIGISVSPSAWCALSAQGRNTHFGLPASEAGLESTELWEWLPTSIHQSDPVRGTELAELEGHAEASASAREICRSITKVAAKSLRNMHSHQLLTVGPVDYSEAARAAATFACRSAATEIALDSPGFWSTLIPIHQDGHWPIAVTSKGEVLVL